MASASSQNAHSSVWMGLTMKLTDEIRIGILIGLYMTASEDAHKMHTVLITHPNWKPIVDIACSDAELRDDLEHEIGLDPPEGRQ